MGLAPTATTIMPQLTATIRGFHPPAPPVPVPHSGSNSRWVQMSISSGVGEIDARRNSRYAIIPQYHPYFIAVSYIATTFSVGELSWS